MNFQKASENRYFAREEANFTVSPPATCLFPHKMKNNKGYTLKLFSNINAQFFGTLLLS